METRNWEVLGKKNRAERRKRREIAPGTGLWKRRCYNGTNVERRAYKVGEAKSGCRCYSLRGRVQISDPRTELRSLFEVALGQVAYDMRRAIVL